MIDRVSSPPMHVVLVGRSDRAEFEPLVNWIEAHGRCGDEACQMTRVADVEAVSTTVPPPQLVVVCESWPDEFPSAMVTQLLGTAPLARIVAVTGAWSEAVGRTRSHWPPALRVPLWQARTRLQRELMVLGLCPSETEVAAAALPWTASRDEAWLWDRVAKPGTMSNEASLRVALEPMIDPALRRWLAETLVADGHQVETLINDEVDVVLFDADPWSKECLLTVRELLSDAPQAAAFAMTAWALPEMIADLAEANVRIVDKLSLDALPSQLAAIVAEHRAGVRCASAVAAG